MLLLPTALLLVFAFDLTAGLIRLRSVDPSDIARTLDAYLATKAPHEFPFPPEFQQVTGAAQTVFLFGASSVVISDALNLGQYLDQELGRDNQNVRVINLGVTGIDSHSIVRRVELALRYARQKPKAIVVYAGHNDYNVAYKYVINGPRGPYGALFNVTLSAGYLLSGGRFDWTNQAHVFRGTRYDFFWYGIYNRPRLYNLLQKAGLYAVDDGAFRAINEKILARFKENIERMIALARGAGVPIAFVTPVANLHAKPYGSLAGVERPFAQGLAEPDPRQALALLRTARDNEIFTGDTRAKSPLVDYLRTLGDGKTTFVFDLERDLVEQGFAFDESNFLDYMHFNDRGHHAVGLLLAHHLRGIPAIRSALGVKP